MKKRVLALLLVTTVIFSLAACGGTNEETKPIDAETALDHKENSIEFETPVIIMENDIARMELLRIWEKEGGKHYVDGGWTYTEDGTTVGLDIQFYNTSDKKYIIMCDTYIGDAGVINRALIDDHSNESPAPGETGVLSITVTYSDGDNELPTELEDLYQLNGFFSLWGNGIPTPVPEYQFSIRDILDGH